MFGQIVSGFGLMTKVDWSTLFKSFYETVRVKVAYKNYTKIPQERLYEMNKKLHLVNFTVEAKNEEPKGKQDDGGDDGGDNDHKGEDEEAYDLYDTDDDGMPKKDPSSSNNPSIKCR